MLGTPASFSFFSLASSHLQLHSFINTFANSVGLQNLGWKYYFVFVAWDVCASVLWYFFCVETVGRTLEELDGVFEETWPARASVRKVGVRVEGEKVG